MTAALFWKEYRQQRSIWLAVAAVGILGVWGLATILGQGPILQALQDGRVHDPATMMVICLMVAFGVISGALLLAGESDDGTLQFLDCLTGRRGQVWDRKCLAGLVFTLFQSMVMAGLALSIGEWRVALALPLVGLSALAWGLLGGALCRTALTAVMAGIGFMAVAWLLFLSALTIVNPVLLAGEVTAGFVAVYFSRRIFCQDDRSRLAAPTQGKSERRIGSPIKGPRRVGAPSEWTVILWLVVRQGRWVLAATAAGAFLLGFAIEREPLYYWPMGTLVIGLVCGLAVFGADQNAGTRFLGAQRIGPGPVWMVKVIFWASAALLLTGVAWFVATVLTWGPLLRIQLPNRERLEAEEHAGSPGFWVDKWLEQTPEDRLIGPALFIGLWPLYGFCFGQFFGQLARRPIIAAFLAICTTLLVLGLWLPSLLLGGVALWQLLFIPLLLLPITRLAMWPWLCSRELDGKPLLGIVGSAVFMVLSLASFLLYRAVQVPDVGEPFDVSAFLASLPPPQKNEAATMLGKAAADMREHREKVEARLEPLTKPVFPDQVDEPSWIDYSLIKAIVLRGWPDNDKEIGKWLDQVFDGKWVREAQEAAPLPVTTLQDPRRPNTNAASNSGAITTLADLFIARSYQLQARGDFRAALNHLETALALARHVHSFRPANPIFGDFELERNILTAVQAWLQKVGPNRDLIQAALTALERHDAASTPDSGNLLKSAYVAQLKAGPTFTNRRGAAPIVKWQRFVALVPWEKERQARIFRAIVLAKFRETQQPLSASKQSSFRAFQATNGRDARMGLPPEEGPGSNVSAKQWGEFIKESSIYDYGFFSRTGPSLFAQSLQLLRGVELVTALALYQADHAAPPAKLEELVPKYLASLPIDPLSGKPFGYAVSKGETLGALFSEELELAPGQAHIFGEGPFMGSMPFRRAVPMWKKETPKKQ